MGDERIIRNRAKIEATISNARVTLELTRDDPGALDRLMWGFAPTKRRGRDRRPGPTSPRSRPNRRR